MKVTMAVSDRVPMELAVPLFQHPDIYGSVMDDLAPSVETVDFAGHLQRSDVYTLYLVADRRPVGFVELVVKSGVCGELHCGFLRGYRGLPAKRTLELAVAIAFTRKGFLKLYCPIPSDNRGARLMVHAVGGVQEGRLTRAFLRRGVLLDILLYGLTREQWLSKAGG